MSGRRHGFTRANTIRSIAVLACALASVTPQVACAKSTAAQGGLHLVRAHRLYMLEAPDGTFSVGVPDRSWNIRSLAIDAATREIIVSPGGTNAPAAYIWEMLPVVDMATNFNRRLLSCFQNRGLLYSPTQCVLQALILQSNAATRKWSAAETMAVISSYARQYGLALDATSLRPRSLTQADVILRERGSRGNFDHRAVLHVEYIANPYLSAFSGRPEWSTFGFLSGCKAPAGTLARIQPICTAILGSFQPKAGWLDAPIRAAMRNYRDQVQTSVNIIYQSIANDQARVSAINRTISQVGQMRLQNQMDWIATDIKVGHDWGNVLGNVADVGIPGSGHFWRVDDNYSYYCEDRVGRVWGTNIDSELDSFDCARKLPRYSPR